MSLINTSLLLLFHEAHQKCSKCTPKSIRREQKKHTLANLSIKRDPQITEMGLKGIAYTFADKSIAT